MILFHSQIVSATQTDNLIIALFKLGPMHKNQELNLIISIHPAHCSIVSYEFIKFVFQFIWNILCKYVEKLLSLLDF